MTRVLTPSDRVRVQWPSIKPSGGSASKVVESQGVESRKSLPLAGRVVGSLNSFRAAESGDMEYMRAFLAAGGEVNKAGKEGYSILHLATMRNQKSMVGLLVESGANPDVHGNGESLTPLMWAAQLGYGRVALKLLEGGADAEQEDREDLTALHWAARMGQERLLLLLLDHDADIEAVDYDGNTPLIWAAREGHRPCVNLLLENGGSTKAADENGNTALHVACQTGHAGIVSDLLDWGALATAQDYWKFTPFHRACSQGHGNVVVELLKAREPGGRDSNNKSSGNLAEVPRSGVRKDESVSSPAMGLLSDIIDLRNHFQATPLHRAAAKGHSEVVSMLLENGANVNARDGFFYTPLHLACINGVVACVGVLLRAGADPTTKAQGGVTPLLAARKPEVRELIANILPVWETVDVAVHGGSIAGDSNDGRGSGCSWTSSRATVAGSMEEEGGDNMVDNISKNRRSRSGVMKAETFTVSDDGFPASTFATLTAGQPPPVVQKVSSPTAVAMELDGAPSAGIAASSKIIGRGRPISRLPRDEGEVRKGSRRTSTGSMLEKIFNGPSNSTWWDKNIEVNNRASLAGSGAAATMADSVPTEKPSLMPSPASEHKNQSATLLRTEPSSSLTSSLRTNSRRASLSPAKQPRQNAATVAPRDHIPQEKLLHNAPRAAPHGPTAMAKSKLNAMWLKHPRTTAPLSPVKKDFAMLTVKNPDVFFNASWRSDVFVGATAVAAVAAAGGVKADNSDAGTNKTATGGGAAAAVALAGVGDSNRVVFKRRRAMSLPPSWEGDEESARRRRRGQPPRPPRKSKLESRPCMDGPTAVIETLMLDDDLPDKALNSWLMGVWKGTSGPGSREGDSPLASPQKLRRATTLMG